MNAARFSRAATLAAALRRYAALRCHARLHADIQLNQLIRQIRTTTTPNTPCRRCFSTPSRLRFCHARLLLTRGALCA